MTQRTSRRMQALRRITLNALKRTLRGSDHSHMKLDEVFFRAMQHVDGSLWVLPRQVHSANLAHAALRRFQRACSARPGAVFLVRFRHENEDAWEEYCSVGAFQDGARPTNRVDLHASPSKLLQNVQWQGVGEPKLLRTRNLVEFGFRGPILPLQMLDARKNLDRPLQHFCRQPVVSGNTRLRSVCAHEASIGEHDELVRRMLAFGVGSVWRREFGFTPLQVLDIFKFQWTWLPELAWLYVRTSSNGQTLFLNDTSVEIQCPPGLGVASAYTCGKPVDMRLLVGEPSDQPLPSPSEHLGNGVFLAHLRGLAEVPGELVRVRAGAQVFEAVNGVADSAFQVSLFPRRRV